MVDYSLWEVIENGIAPPITEVIKGVKPTIAPATLEERHKEDAKSLLQAVEKSTRSINGAVNTTHGVSTASTQATDVNSTTIDNLSDAVICSFFASQPNSSQLDNKDLQQIYPDDLEEMDLRWQVAMLTMRARRFLKNIRRKFSLNGNETISTKRTVPMETPASAALVSCDGLGGYDWSDQTEDVPTNFALMTYSSKSSNSKIMKKLMEEMLPLEVTSMEENHKERVPRKNNMYSVDLKNIVPKGDLTCLFSKATSDESKLWHRRLGHLNFKTMNKLVKGNLVLSLASKDEASAILKTFMIGIENLIDHKVKEIRCDNGTEFKNREMNRFCEMKGITRQYSVAKTPQQNKVAERRNRTLIEAARTMLADSKLPTTF
nr:ribonuclease H-like domain-containing protein [Tanacetum cinerariifolium]